MKLLHLTGEKYSVISTRLGGEKSDSPAVIPNLRDLSYEAKAKEEGSLEIRRKISPSAPSSGFLLRLHFGGQVIRRTSWRIRDYTKELICLADLLGTNAAIDNADL